MHRQAQAPATPRTPAPAAPILAQDADLGSLQTQLGDLRVEHAGLKAQWDGLKSQLDNMLRNNPARPGVQQQWANVGVQLANVDGKIATVEARIALKQGRTISAPIANPEIPFIPRLNFVPNLVVPAAMLMTLALALPISIASARRILRRAPRPTPVPSDVTMRLERIEQAVDTIAIEVERISEGQRFVTRLMAERPSTAGSNQAAQGNDAGQQPLMLGAGAMEPIVVAERERVRQRAITPH